MASPEREDGNTEDRGFLGHPRGLATLFFTEAWERFSYYGMRAILLYYMYEEVRDGGLGIDEGAASSLIAAYGAAIYMAAIAGGWVSDRLLGARRATLWGGLLIMCGHLCLATPLGKTALFTSMAFIVAGTGLLKPNVSVSVGRLYAPGDARRDAGFSLYYMGISVGAVLAPLLVGWLGQSYDYHLGFGLAAAGMAAGLLVYARGRRQLSSTDLLAPHPLRKRPWEGTPRAVWLIGGSLALLLALATVAGPAGVVTVERVVDFLSVLAVALPIGYFTMMLRSRRTTPAERRRVRGYLPLFVGAVFFWLIQEQGASVLAQYADHSTDLDALGFAIPSSWFQSTGSFVLIVLTPLFAVLWVRLGPRAPSAPVKFGCGLVLAGLSYVLLVLPAMQPGKSNPLWLLGSFAILTVGELLLSPIGLSVTAQVAPAAFATRMMGLWLASNAAAQGISAQVVQVYDRAHAAGYFAVVGGAGVTVGLLLLTAAPVINRRMGRPDGTAEAPSARPGPAGRNTAGAHVPGTRRAVPHPSGEESPRTGGEEPAAEPGPRRE
ncbi:peptide MFS transporter [Streptomyces diacarni]|uniref:peptide MFS transporter n=1 Tax=Streptomyces diacarni TaxID=2800381 RepID=UPI0034014871